jgi:hypothetical protein
MGETSVGDQINNDTTLNLSYGADFSLQLPADWPSDLASFSAGSNAPAAKGFSWAKNGSLKLSNDFHGWVQCQGGNWNETEFDSAFF